MRRINRYPLIILCAALIAVAWGPAAAPSFAASRTTGPTTPATPATSTNCATTARTLTGTLADGATYLIQVPANWNCTLFLYSHGYVTPGSANPAQDVGDPVTGAWMLSQGYALAGSSYASTGWAIQQALPDQINTLNVFDQQVGRPSRTIAWGHSLGGIITAGLIQDYPSRFSAALPMCGVLSGGVATWNTALDSEFAFQQLIDPSVQVVNISNPSANLTSAEEAAAAAQQTPQGRARLALAAALADTPGWFTPLSPEPAASDYAGQESNQYLWDTEVDFPFVFAFRAELQARAGGNPSWNTGVNYFSDLARSTDLREVVALYRAAGLSLTKDLATLNAATRVSASPSAVRYLATNIAFNGHLAMPVLTMHTTGDGLVVPENEQAYADAVNRAGDSRLLRQIFVSRAGHCAFTPAETITAVRTLLNRLATGRWNDKELQPSILNAQAAALGQAENVYSSGGQVVATPAAFVAYRPAPYLRPYDLPLGPFGGGGGGGRGSR
ncbi:MAG TPA: prolyl oligopeptidase family serine peptidase [Streptosporangiaceae bacterium]|nr:prolyl oligopeptidase family serine peptidase [Streptosporangiaceae bacterium]